jgi:hypothetical protein
MIAAAISPTHKSCHPEPSRSIPASQAQPAVKTIISVSTSDFPLCTKPVTRSFRAAKRRHGKPGTAVPGNVAETD